MRITRVFRRGWWRLWLFFEEDWSGFLEHGTLHRFSFENCERRSGYGYFRIVAVEELLQSIEQTYWTIRRNYLLGLSEQPTSSFGRIRECVAHLILLQLLYFDHTRTAIETESVETVESVERLCEELQWLEDSLFWCEFSVEAMVSSLEHYNKELLAICNILADDSTSATLKQEAAISLHKKWLPRLDKFALSQVCFISEAQTKIALLQRAARGNILWGIPAVLEPVAVRLLVSGYWTTKMVLKGLKSEWSPFVSFFLSLLTSFSYIMVVLLAPASAWPPTSFVICQGLCYLPLGVGATLRLIDYLRLK